MRSLRKKVHKETSPVKKRSELRKKALDFFSENVATLKKIEKISMESLETLNEIREIKKTIKELAKKIIYSNECTSQTLCSVLLAINQNEYLKAWYPENGKVPEPVSNKYVDDLVEICSINF